MWPVLFFLKEYIYTKNEVCVPAFFFFFFFADCFNSYTKFAFSGILFFDHVDKTYVAGKQVFR